VEGEILRAMSRENVEVVRPITMRDGEQTSLKLYQTRQHALEAAGLRE
jgi:hypothetical protein